VVGERHHHPGIGVDQLDLSLTVEPEQLAADGIHRHAFDLIRHATVADEGGSPVGGVDAVEGGIGLVISESVDRLVAGDALDTDRGPGTGGRVDGAGLVEDDVGGEEGLSRSGGGAQEGQKEGRLE